MAVDSNDPTTGAPRFADTGAPDIGVDPTEAAKYAADVGNRIVRQNLAGLDAYAYKRAGLMGHALDTKSDYIHSGTGWRLLINDTGWQTLALNPGWTVFSGETPKWRVQNGRLAMTGRVSGTAAASGTIGALPAEARAVSAGQAFAFPGWSDSHGIVMLYIGHSDGTINVVQGAGAVRTGISVATITYPVG